MICGRIPIGFFGWRVREGKSDSVDKMLRTANCQPGREDGMLGWHLPLASREGRKSAWIAVDGGLRCFVRKKYPSSLIE
jgi:hypothetical protein